MLTRVDLFPFFFSQANDELPVAQQQHRKLQTIVPSPLVSTKCMQDNWKAAGNKQDLVCEAKEVWLENMEASRPATCVAGGWTTLDLSASVVFNAERYDMGWYIATDGGTALTGQCVIKPLLQKDGPLSVVDKPGSTKVLTNVTWTKDFKGGNDLCGDIIGGGGTLDFMRIGNNVQLPCIDKDGDGILDFGICFSWKVAGSDTKCNPVSLFPGTPSKCFCARYNIPQIQVLPMPKPVTTVSKRRKQCKHHFGKDSMFCYVNLSMCQQRHSRS